MSIFDRLDRPLLHLSSSVSNLFAFCTACCRSEDGEDDEDNVNEGNIIQVEPSRDDEMKKQDQRIWHGYRDHIYSNGSSIPSSFSMDSSNPHPPTLEGYVNPSIRFLESPMESPRDLAQAMMDYRRRVRERVQKHVKEKSRTAPLVETQDLYLSDLDLVPITAPKLENLSPTTVALMDDVRDYWIIVRAMGIEG